MDTCSFMDSMFATTSVHGMSAKPSMVAITSLYRSYSRPKNSSSFSVFSSSGYRVTVNPKSLAVHVRVPLAFAHLEQSFVLVQPLDGFERFHAGDHRTVRVPVRTELGGIDDKPHLLQQLALEPGLQPL